MAAKGKQTIETAIVTLDQVERRIYMIRGNKVMLDSELASLYGVTTSALNRAVKRRV
ncbi:MAG: ORF6N domain-containing protein [Chloracidobacterium sp.]|nr:ORF6N domain-containing protein [Chloracidobacterium sp.]